MIILLLIILFVAGLIAIRKWKKHQSRLNYWEHINELEQQRKEQILRRALENQRVNQNKQPSAS